jgi:predicted TPR repeat methyltransferase
LHEAEAVEFLQRHDSAWELIVVADVVIYVGPLDSLFQAAITALLPGGWLALSAEAALEKDVELDPATARHRHGKAYLERSLGQAGFRDVQVRDTCVRRERGSETAGYLVLAQRPSE